MPELPEVEVVRRGVADHVVGHVISDVDVLDERSIRRHRLGATDFVSSIAGRGVTAARRRGKYLWLALDDVDGLVIHLGMSGQLLIKEHDAPLEKHLRVRFRLADGRQLRFVDQRIFGHLFLSRDGAQNPAEIAHIAPDPLSADFDIATFTAAIRRKRTELKRALLDQSLVSGIGNIYADEALWLAGLHYRRRTEKLRPADIVRVVAAVQDVMGRALSQGGTSFDALYVNINGQSGYFDRSLYAYGRAEEPCARCGGPIRREPFMNRSSYFCPRCQRPPRVRS